MLRKENNQRSMAVLLIFIFTITIGYFLVFEGNNMIHDCSRSDCAICHELHQAQSMTKQLQAGMVFDLTGIYQPVVRRDANAWKSCLISRRTLISDKVRIDA